MENIAYSGNATKLAILRLGMASVSDSNRAAEQARYEAFEAERARSRKNHQDEIQELKEDFEKTQTQSKSEQAERMQRLRDEAREDVRKLKEENYDRQGKQYANDSRDYSSQKEELERYRNELEKSYQQKNERLEEQSERRTSKTISQQEEKTAEALAAQKKSHLLEMKKLQEVIDQQSLDTRDIDAERAKARAQAIQDVELKAIRNQQNADSAYEIQLQKIKANSEDSAAQLRSKLIQKDYESAAKTQKQLMDQKSEFVTKDQQRVQHMNRLEDLYQQDLRAQQEKTRKADLNLNDLHEAQTRQALGEQQKVLHQYYQDDQARLSQQLKMKEDEVAHLKTTDHEKDVSPALIAKIRNQSTEKHFQEREAERKHHENQMIGLEQKDRAERMQMKDLYDKRVQENDKSLKKNYESERRQAMMALQDIQGGRSEEMIQLKNEHSENLKRTQMKNAVMLENERKKASFAATMERDESREQLAQMAVDAQRAQREHDHEWQVKFNEQRRTYEKEMNRVQDENAIERSQAKLDFDLNIKAQERVLKRAADERIKSYEQQLRQQELSFKEKERFMTEQYQTEMDKLKQSYEQLRKAKS